MQEAKMLKIMAGAMQDAMGVVNHVWEETHSPTEILENFSHLRETMQWYEYNVRVIPFLLTLTNTKPHPETQKYIGVDHGEKALLYADLFAMCLLAHVARCNGDELNVDYADEEEKLDLETEGEE